MKPPIELPTSVAALDADLAQEGVDEPAVAGNADLLLRQLGLAEARQVDGDRRGGARAKWGMFSSQFCQQPASPWMKTTGGPSPIST